MIYSRSLDGLRGVAILLVMLFHFNFIVGLGWVGVQLFFVLSGFLITSILLKEKENPLASYLKRFYWRRSLRIFPLYYAYLIFAGIAFIITSLPEEFLRMLPYLATYTFNFYPLVNVYTFHDVFFTHFWSLSVEEQFYLFWPVVVYFCSREKLKRVLIATIVLVPVVRLILAEVLLANGESLVNTGQIVYRFTACQLDGFAFGALIPVFGLGQRNLKVGKPILLTVAVSIAVGLVNAYRVSIDGGPMITSAMGFRIGDLVNYQHVWSYTLFNFLFFLFIIYITNPNSSSSFIKIFLENSVMVYMGKISYGLYIYHWIIWMAFGKYLFSFFPFQGVGLVVYLGICTGVASVSYYLLEKPFLSMKDNFFPPMKLARNESN